MCRDLLIELIAEDDHVLALFGVRVLLGIAAVPDLRLIEEAEALALHHFGRSNCCVGAEENRGAKDTFEGSHQPSGFFPTFVHAKSLEHFGGSAKADGLALLPSSQGRQVDGNDPVLAEG